MLARPGFTLIELLAAIAIMAFLAGLLLPAVSTAKAAGRKAVCQGNLRQQGLALRMYVDEWGKYPPVLQWPTPNQESVTWETGLRRYAGGLGSGPGAFRCAEWVLRNTRGCYGYNSSGTVRGNATVFFGAFPPTLGLGSNVDPGNPATFAGLVSESQVRAPADMIALADNSSRETARPDMAVMDVGFAPAMAWPGKVHRGGANVVFCDGHVEYARQTNWLAPVTAARRRWNNDNEPHPETWAKQP